MEGSTANHSIPRPNCAPACEYVPIVDGSSSAAPVINPGPNDLRIALNDNKKDLYDGNTYPHFYNKEEDKMFSWID